MKRPFDARALEQIDSPDATAAAYFSHFRSPHAGAQDYVAFEYWLARDEAHRTAWEKVERMWDGVGELRASAEVESLQKQALGSRKAARVHWAKPALAAAVALFAVMGGGLFYAQQNNASLFTEEGARLISTGIGQQASFRMADGSLITVNTGSSLSVAETGTARSVEVKQGEALFEVEKNAKRPFTVATGGLKVTALGTAFSVRNTGNGIGVTLVHGRVRVDLPSAGQNAARSVTLEPGMALLWKQGELQLSHVNTDRSLSWRSGMLSFDRTPLADAVAEVNRYSPHQIIVTDPVLKQRRISGSFRIGTPRGFLQSLQAAGVARVGRKSQAETQLVSP